MGKAHNFAEFQAALSASKCLLSTSFMVVFARVNIMYIYNGMIPERCQRRFQILAWRCTGRPYLPLSGPNHTLMPICRR